MGDKRRFALFADLIAVHHHRSTVIADVAGGKGGLQMALRERGFNHVVTIDKRRRRIRKAKVTATYNLKWFNGKAPKRVDLVVGMHPDEATDHIILGAVKLRVPFMVCPCCIKPDAVPYNDKRGFNAWLGHLRTLAHRHRFNTRVVHLEMRGRNQVLIGMPAPV